MNNSEKSKKGLWLTLLSALIIIVLAGLAFLPSIMNRQTSATTFDSTLDADAMQALGAAGAYVAANDFETAMNGTIKAKVVGIPYTQKVHGKRTVSGEQFCDVAESTSAIVKAAIKRERKDGSYYVSQGNYKNKAFSYPAAKQLSHDKYVSQYGQPFTGIVKYNLNNTVLKAEKVGQNKYVFTLDPAQATLYSRNEVKTTLGGKSYPKYESVTFTLTTDGERPVKVTATEKFTVDKFGGTSCTAQYTEVFKFNN